MLFSLPYYADHKSGRQSEVNALSVVFYGPHFYHYDICNLLLLKAANQYSSWKKINYEIQYYNY